MSFVPLSESFHNFNPWVALGLVVVYVVVDALFAAYTLAVTDRKPLQAANIAFLMYFFLALGVLSYVNNYLYVLPIAAGSWIGTFIVVKHAPFKKHQK